MDQFGEMTITNGNIVCKLTFTKVSSDIEDIHELLCITSLEETLHHYLLYLVKCP